MDAAAIARLALAVYFEVARQHGIREKELMQIYGEELKKYKERDPRDLPDAHGWALR